MHQERFKSNQNYIEANHARDNLIGRTQEKIFQIRMQEIIARYSSKKKFPTRIILPDTKVRPMGPAIKDVFYYLADINGFTRPKVEFVATPKISTNNRPDQDRTIFDEYGIITLSHMAELKNTTLLDSKEFDIDYLSGKVLSNEDRQNMQNCLLVLRATLASRIKELKIADGSNVLVFDEVVHNFTSFCEIGIDINTLKKDVNLYLESIFYTGNVKFLQLDVRKCNTLFGNLLKGQDLFENVSNYHDHFKWYDGNFENAGIDNNGETVYLPHKMQRAVGVIKKPNQFHSQKIEDLSAEDKRNIRVLRQRLRYIAGKALFEPMTEEEIKDFQYVVG
jgi:hypothetical protein